MPSRRRVVPPRLLLGLEHALGDPRRGHRGGPAGVERHVGDDLADLLLGDAVGERPLDVALELVAAIQCREGGHGDEAAVALRELRALPHVPEEDLLAEVDELRDDGTDFFAGRVRSDGCHAVLLWPGCRRPSRCGDVIACGCPAWTTWR